MSMSPHSMPNLKEMIRHAYKYMTITNCSLCTKGFSHDDLVVDDNNP